MAEAQSTQIQWTCRECGFPVADGRGYVHIDHQAVSAVAQLRDEREARSDDSRPQTLGEFLADWIPDATWDVHHDECDPEHGVGSYIIEVERARSHAQLLHWTAHLMGKNWLSATNWDVIIREASGVSS